MMGLVLLGLVSCGAKAVPGTKASKPKKAKGMPAEAPASPLLAALPPSVSSAVAALPQTANKCARNRAAELRPPHSLSGLPSRASFVQV